MRQYDIIRELRGWGMLLRGLGTYKLRIRILDLKSGTEFQV